MAPRNNTAPSPSPLPTYLFLPTKITCPSCSKDLYYYPPTKINNVKSPLVLSCASCTHVFPLPTSPEDAMAKLSITETHYDILGVPKTATPDEISRAYRKKSLKCHPDRTTGREKEWEQLTKAYDILGDKRKRHWYDVELEKGVVDPNLAEDPLAQSTPPSYEVMLTCDSQNGP
jgi:hypothetical protein